MRTKQPRLLAASAGGLLALIGALAWLDASNPIGESAAAAPGAGERAEVAAPSPTPVARVAAEAAREQVASVDEQEWRRWGRVVDLSDAAVPGARVTLEEGGVEREVGISDERGRFPWVSDTSAEQFLVDASGWMAVLTCDPRSARGAAQRKIVVAPSAPIRGRVVSNGRPLAAARVGLALDLGARRASFDPSLQPASIACSRNVDERGRFQFTSAPLLAGLRLKASCGGYEPQSFDVDVELARTQELSLELREIVARFGVLHGRVVRADGTAVAQDAHVAWGANSARTDRNGQFQLALSSDPEGAPIVVRAPGFADASSPARREHLTDASIELTLGPPLEALHGQLAADDSAKLKGCIVQLYRDEGCSTLAKSTRTDAYGRYAFEGLEPGEYWIVARAAGVESRLGPVPSGGRADELRISR